MEECDNPRPITYQSNYSACLVNNPLNINGKSKYTITGKHCESGDVLFKEIDLADCRTGDLICVFGTGAYNYSMSSNYNKFQDLLLSWFVMAKQKLFKRESSLISSNLMFCLIALLNKIRYI